MITRASADYSSKWSHLSSGLEQLRRTNQSRRRKRSFVWLRESLESRRSNFIRGKTPARSSARSSFHKHIYRHLDALQWRFNLANAFRSGPQASVLLSPSVVWLDSDSSFPSFSVFLAGAGSWTFSIARPSLVKLEIYVCEVKKQYFFFFSFFFEWIVRPDPSAYFCWMHRWDLIRRIFLEYLWARLSFRGSVLFGTLSFLRVA